MADTNASKIVLASASISRASLLKHAGVHFEAIPSHCDEDAIKNEMKGRGATADQVAERLAMTKAETIAIDYPNHFVIGADQMLACGGVWYDKPADIDAARGHLKSLRGKTHHLVSATVILLGEKCVWHYEDISNLTMRDFSDDFIEVYLNQAGEKVCRSVGAYQLEGLGAQLFSAVEGDYFSILGLPLLPMMAFLRANKLLID